MKGRPGWMRNPVLRAASIVFFLSMLLFPVSLYRHFSAHFMGSITGSLIRDQWWLVLLNIVIFISFLIPLSFRKKVDWKGFGLVGAFFVSLFVEMYGLPLTIFFVSRYLGGGSAPAPDLALEVELLGVGFGFTIPMVYGSLMMLLGTALIVVGWVTLFKGVKKGVLVTSGVYSVSRHPQYLGFILVVGGWMIGWPTILTLILGSVLVAWYVRVCIVEEREMRRIADYDAYKRRVPFLI